MSATKECPLESVAAAIAFSPMDWSLDHRLAWIYGIALGWDEVLPEIAARHGWDSATIARIQRLREGWKSLIAE